MLAMLKPFNFSSNDISADRLKILSLLVTSAAILTDSKYVSGKGAATRESGFSKISYTLTGILSLALF